MKCSRDSIQRDLQLLLDDAHRKQRRLDAGNQTLAEAHAGQQADEDELIFPGSLSSTEDEYLPPLDIEGHGIEPVIQLCVLDAAKAQVCSEWQTSDSSESSS